MRIGERVGFGSFGFGVLATVVGSCGGGGGGPAPLESAALCEAGWQPLAPAAPFEVTSSLAYRDGVVYYTAFSTSSLMAFPVAGGQATAIATGAFASQQIWVDGDQILVPGGDLGTQVFSVPAAGGAPTLAIDGAAGRADTGVAIAYALTPTDFFWLEVGRTMPGGQTNAWRVPRAGGTPTMIGSASATSPSGADDLVFDHLAVTSDAVLMAEGLGIAVALPFDGSPARPLTTSDDLARGQGDYAGIDAAGVYWTVPRAGARAEDDEWSVALAPADGGPLRTFWDGLPAHSSVWRMWPDAAGGWIVVAGQLFDDLKLRLAIWVLDANGQGRRLACSPPAETSIPDVTVGPAVAPDAIYLEDSGSKFQIVRVAR